jgi:hypothetical protein
MREFYLNPLQYNKWEYQQRKNKKRMLLVEMEVDR